MPRDPGLCCCCFANCGPINTFFKKISAMEVHILVLQSLIFLGRKLGRRVRRVSRSQSWPRASALRGLPGSSRHPLHHAGGGWLASSATGTLRVLHSNPDLCSFPFLKRLRRISREKSKRPINDKIPKMEGQPKQLHSPPLFLCARFSSLAVIPHFFSTSSCSRSKTCIVI